MLQLKQQNSGHRSEWLVENRYTFGTGSDNHYQVSGDGVQAIQAGLEVNGDDVKLFNLGGGNCVAINGSIVEKNEALKPGDEFTVGNDRFLIEDPKQNRKPAAQAVDVQTDWTLKASNTALANKSFIIQGSQTLGRSKECDICLNVVHLSRRHAQITVKDNYLQVDDLNSSNGTYVNGKRVNSAQVRAGDEIGFDTLKFSVIGPSNSLEKTQVRQGTVDSDATTMRPMIKESDLKGVEPKQAPKPKKVREEAVSKVTASAPKEEQNPENKTGVMLLGIIVVLIAAAITYVFFG